MVVRGGVVMVGCSGMLKNGRWDAGRGVKMTAPLISWSMIENK